MKHEYLVELDSDALDMLAQALHVDVSGAKTKAAKVRLVEGASGRSAHVSVLGLDVEVPRVATRDLRVQRIIQKPGATDAEADELVRLLVGDAQHDAIVERCTDEDGRVDVDAYAVAVSTLISDETVKNWLLSLA